MTIYTYQDAMKYNTGLPYYGDVYAINVAQGSLQGTTDQERLCVSKHR
jgi:hypothetical protein